MTSRSGCVQDLIRASSTLTRMLPSPSSEFLVIDRRSPLSQAERITGDKVAREIGLPIRTVRTLTYRGKIHVAPSSLLGS
jgi:hypothetical protein